MTKERALEYWINRYNNAKDYSDIHWDAEERHEHRDYIRAMAWAIKAIEQYEEHNNDVSKNYKSSSALRPCAPIEIHYEKQ